MSCDYNMQHFIRSTSDQEAACPLKFSYGPFGFWFVVVSDFPKDQAERVFQWSSGPDRVKKLCERNTQCDHIHCEYQQELIRAMCAVDSSVDPRVK